MGNFQHSMLYKNSKIKSLISLSVLFLLLWIILPRPTSAIDNSAPVVEDIIIRGNEYFSADKIKDQMTISKNKWYNFLKRRKFYGWKLRQDQDAIEIFYNNHGFLDAQVQTTHIVGDKNNATVYVDIIEGIQTRLISVKTEGGKKDFASKIRKFVRELKLNSPMNPLKLEETAFHIKTIYANNGYPYAEIITQIYKSEDKKDADVVFKIDPKKEARFGEVFFKGLHITQKKKVQRELTVKPGELYSRAKIIDSQQRVYSTGLFSYVNLEAVNPEEKPTNPDFLLKVVERKPNYVDFKFGLGHYQPPNQTLDLNTADIRLEWGNRNLNGSGRKISTSLFSSYAIFPNPDFPISADSIKNLLYRFNLRFVEPWVFGKRILGDMDFYYEPGVKSIIRPYQIESYGVDLNFTKEVSPFTKVWLTPSFQWVNIYNVPPEEEEEEIKREEGINVRRKLILRGENDTRDNFFMPLNGSLTRFHSELVGGFMGGENHFFKLIFSWNRYLRLGRPGKLNVLGSRIKLGYVEKIKAEEYVPTFDRFYMGGASTIRGYPENNLGPKDTKGIPKGGRVMILGNLEWRRALFWKFGYTLFVDAGNLWFEPEHMSLESIRMTAGLGIQFFTPIGPLRLDYAHRVIRKDDPKGGRFHLSILYAF